MFQTIVWEYSSETKMSAEETTDAGRNFESIGLARWNRFAVVVEVFWRAADWPGLWLRDFAGHICASRRFAKCNHPDAFAFLTLSSHSHEAKTFHMSWEQNVAFD